MDWACPDCHAALLPVEQRLACPACQTAYPLAHGIPVLARHGQSWLEATRLIMAMEGLEIAAQARAQPGPERAARAANHRTIAQLCEPHLGPYPPGGLDPAVQPMLPKSGWAIGDLVPYFCHDWSARVRERPGIDRIVDTARSHARRGSVAVLGCGAGRLLGELSLQFDHAIGIDLSLTALMLSQRLLDGAAFDLALEAAGWSAVALTGMVTGSCALACTDAAHLPLADGSIDCLVTQYLLDVVPDAAAVADEVRRVLAPGGTWIGLGLPFSEGTGDAQGLSQWLTERGFAPLEAVPMPIGHLSFAEIDPSALGESHQALFFAARALSS